MGKQSKSNVLQTEENVRPSLFNSQTDIEEKNISICDFSEYYNQLNERKKQESEKQKNEVEILKTKLQNTEDNSESHIIISQIKGPGTLIYVKPDNKYVQTINHTSEINDKQTKINIDDIICEIHISPNSENTNTDEKGNIFKLVDDLVEMLKYSIESIENKPKYIIGFSYLTPLLTKILQRKFKLTEGVDFELMTKIPEELVSNFHLSDYIDKNNIDRLLEKSNTVIGKENTKKFVKIINNIIQRSEDQEEDKNKFISKIKQFISRKLRRTNWKLQRAITYQNVKKKYTIKDAQLLIIPVETIQKLF